MPREFWLSVIPIAALGLLLRIYFAAEPLWLDELHTAWSVDTTFLNVAERAGYGNQTPVYFWLTAGITSIFGNSPSTLRALSLVSGVASILVIAAVVYRLSKSLPASIGSAILIAADTWLLFYSTEARPYAMLQFFCLLQFLALVHFLENGATGIGIQSKLSRCALPILTGLILATHLTGGLMIIAEVLTLAMLRRNRWKTAILLVTAGAIFASPALLFAFSAVVNREQWLPSSGPEKLIREWQLPIMLQTLPAIVITTYCYIRNHGSSMLRMWCVASIVWALVPLTIALGLDVLSIPVASYRYTTVSSLAPMLCLALSVSLISSQRIVATLLACLTLTSILLNPIMANFLQHGAAPRFRNEDWKSAIQFVNKATDSDRKLVLLFANLYEDRDALANRSRPFQEYLSFPLRGIYPIQNQTNIVSMPTQVPNTWGDEQINQITDHQEAYLICRVNEARFNQIKTNLAEQLKRKNISFEIESFFRDDNMLKIAVVTTPHKVNKN